MAYPCRWCPQTASQSQTVTLRGQRLHLIRRSGSHSRNTACTSSPSASLGTSWHQPYEGCCTQLCILAFHRQRPRTTLSSMSQLYGSPEEPAEDCTTAVASNQSTMGAHSPGLCWLPSKVSLTSSSWTHTSKWPEVHAMRSATSEATVSKLRDLCATFGVPRTIVTDNGTQFTSSVFNGWCQENGIQHVTSPPYHPQSNGQAERFVDTFKRALLKSRGEGSPVKTLPTFLFAYRTTPNPNTPAWNITGRMHVCNGTLRTTLDCLIPRNDDRATDLQPGGQLTTRREAATRNFQLDDAVFARDYRGLDRWTPGIISRKRGTVMYDVQVREKMWSRHVNQLRSSTSPVATNTNIPLELDILLDTFDIQTTENSGTTQEKRRVSLQPRRWTDRHHRPIQRLQVDPTRQTYSNTSEGGVRSIPERLQLRFRTPKKPIETYSSNPVSRKRRQHSSAAGFLPLVRIPAF